MSENLSTYAKADPLGNLTVSPASVVGLGIRRNETTLLSDDKGAGFFSGDFTHLMEFDSINATGVGVCGSWALTNLVDNFRDLFVANESFLVIQHNTGNTFILREFISGGVTDDFTGGLTPGQKYYLTIIRDESIGAFGQLSCGIYSDSGRTVLVVTLSILLNAKLDLRYNFAIISFDDNNTGALNLTVSNLDLGGVVAATGRRRRMLLRSN